MALVKRLKYYISTTSATSILYYFSDIKTTGPLCFTGRPNWLCARAWRSCSVQPPASPIIHAHPHTSPRSSPSVIKYDQVYCIGTNNDVVCNDILTLFTATSSYLTFVSVLSGYSLIHVSPLIYWWPLVQPRHLKVSCQGLKQTSQRDRWGSGCLSQTS